VVLTANTKNSIIPLLGFGKKWPAIQTNGFGLFIFTSFRW